MPLRGGGGGRRPNGKCHLKFPFWLSAPVPYTKWKCVGRLRRQQQYDDHDDDNNNEEGDNSNDDDDNNNEEDDNSNDDDDSEAEAVDHAWEKAAVDQLELRHKLTPTADSKYQRNYQPAYMDRWRGRPNEEEILSNAKHSPSPVPLLAAHCNLSWKFLDKFWSRMQVQDVG